MSSKPAQLQREILSLSIAQNWDAARREWAPAGVFNLEKDEPAGVCLCGQNPIRQLCQLRNSQNNRWAIVGNCCVLRFFEYPANAVLASIKRVAKKPSGSLHVGVLDLAIQHGWLSARDRSFYQSVRAKRDTSLAAGDKARKQRINAVILREQETLRRKTFDLPPLTGRPLSPAMAFNTLSPLSKTAGWGLPATPKPPASRAGWGRKR